VLAARSKRPNTRVSESCLSGPGIPSLGVQLATGAHVVALDPLSGQSVEVDAGSFSGTKRLIEKSRLQTIIGIIVSTKPDRPALNWENTSSPSDKAYLVFMKEVSP